jgi:dolichyl-phosphate-mannose-protein mannosyltransferase
MLRLYRPLVALTALAVAMRVVVMIAYSSAVFVYYNGDALRYARVSPQGGHLDLFSDHGAPAGYAIFLAAVREIWSALSFTIGLQHLLGMATGLLFYAALRRIGAPRGFALVPAALVFFSGDQIFLEHALLTESLWAVLIAGGLYALLRGVGEDSVDWRWLAVGGVALGYAGVVRPVGMLLLVVAAVWVALALRVELARCARAAAAVVLPAAILVGVYVGIAALDQGTSGLGELAGFQLYGRVAQFADCTKFKPPGRTRLLCQTTPSARRPGPNGQLFASDAPLLQQPFNVDSRRDSALLGRFAQQAILHQPGAYASAVLEDYKRIVGLGHGRPGDGANPWQMRFDLPYAYGNPAGATTPEQIAGLYRVAYTSVRAHPLSGWGQALGTYQGVVRLHEGLVIVLLVLGFVGVSLGTARARAGAGLFLGAALCLYLVPALIAQWDVRYGVLPGELLAVAATIGAWAVWERRQAISATGRSTPPHERARAVSRQ